MHTFTPCPVAPGERNLAGCPVGTRGWIVSVQDGPDANRLKAMGLCAGHAIQVARAGDPMVVDIFNSRVALARQLAAGIGITVGTGTFDD